EKREEYTGPRTAVEEMLANLWAELLGLERVSIHDNFFALGGHSLRAMQAVSRIRQVFGIELSVRELFEYPTISEFAESISEKLKVHAELKSDARAPIPRLAERRPEDLQLSY